LPQGIDHIVHVVRDLDAAGDFYRRLGFTVGARNIHPWGTHNRIVQFKTSFIELLEIGEPAKIPPHGKRAFSFGAFNRDFVAAREGLSMLILKSMDARADARSFEAAEISDFEVFDFGRDAKRPDGSTVEVAFSLAFAREPSSPGLGFAVCQQHFPENFWNLAFQLHANGATGMPGVVMVADNPSDHHVFLKGFTGISDLHSSSLGIKATTAHGEIEIIEPVAFRDQFGVTPDISGEGMALNAIRFAVADMAKAESIFAGAGVKAERHIGGLVVRPDSAYGATLIFGAAKVG
jgi:catechol 2,3-dioxygenase-like lactoylglutathione lyase family enzyme